MIFLPAPDAVADIEAGLDLDRIAWFGTAAPEAV